MSQFSLHRWLGLLAAVIVAASACGGNDGQDDSASNGADAPDVVRIVSCANAFNPSWTPIYAAEGTGAFDAIEEQFGTQFELNNLAGAPCIATLASGEQDIVNSVLATSVTFAAQDRLTVEFLHPFTGPGVVLVLANQFQTQEEEGTDWASVSGARIATTGQETQTGQMLRVIMTEYNFQPEEIVIPDLLTFPAVLKSGRIDGFVATPAEAAQVLSDGTGYLAENLNDPAAQERFGALPPAGVSASLPDFVDEYPELTQAIVDAVIQALHDIQQNVEDAESIRQMLPADVQAQFDSEEWQSQWEIFKPGFLEATGGLTQDVFAESVEFFSRTGAVPKGKTIPGSIVNNEFVLQAYENLDLPAPDLPEELESVTP